MNPNRDLDRLLDSWFAEGPLVVADRVVSDAAARIAGQPQRPAWRLRSWRFPTMSTPMRLAALTGALLVAIVGGSVLLFSGGGLPRAPITPSASPTASPSPTPALSPSVGVAGACDLMTPAEAGTALRISSAVTAQPLIALDINAVGPPESWFCEFHSGSTSLFVLRYERETGANAFASWKIVKGVEAVPGLGDEAVWDPAKGTMYILKGIRLVTILPLDRPTPTLTLAAAKAIGAFVVGRM